MNYQKDNNKKGIENKDITTNSSIKPANYFNVFDHDVYISIAERSSKIVTALYMVTDFLDGNDPLRSLVRSTITDIMHKLFSLTHAYKIDRVEILSDVQNMLYANISYLNVVYRNGFVSDMNYNVIIGEMNDLRSVVDAQIKKSLPYDKKGNNTTSVEQFTFSNEFFGENTHTHNNIKDTKEVTPVFKDINKNQTVLKKTLPIKVSLEHGNKNNEIVSKKTLKNTKVNQAKELRKENILKILKQKRNASINDICALFKDCSSKTIQRDLMDLIDQGLVKKEGSRRWSKYNLTY